MYDIRDVQVHEFVKSRLHDLGAEEAPVAEDVGCFEKLDRVMERVIHCYGSHLEIGRTHGKTARSQIEASIAFYTELFKATVHLTWLQAKEISLRFIPALERHVPHLLEEMRGIAEGSGQSIADILVLNARSEIALTQSHLSDPPDGCTAFSRLCDDTQWLQQNWDWSAAQMAQIVVLRITTPQGLKITTICEAGQVGKVGMNATGVGVTLNALKTVQMNVDMLPIHVALRHVLEAQSVDDAVARLEETGVASAAHFLVADSKKGIGLEVNPVRPFGKIEADSKGNIFHTNHCISSELPRGLTEVPWLKDSPLRLSRIEQLVDGLTESSFDSIFELFKDEQGLPNAINRDVEPDVFNKICTVFTLIMNCTTKHMRVTLGRPTEYTYLLEFDAQI